MDLARSMTEALAVEIQKAVGALPASHQLEPQDGELVNNLGDVRLQDWAFVQGLALKKAVGLNDGFYIVFIIMIQQKRKIASELGLLFMQWYVDSLCISAIAKKINSWAIGYTHREHNHPMNPDPFAYIIHRNRQPGHDKAAELARGLRGEVSYKKVRAILQNHDLNIEHKEYYNLARREATKKLNASLSCSPGTTRVSIAAKNSRSQLIYSCCVF